MSREAAGPVLVVGAGPAGSSVALRLARAGIPVTLLDAREFPRSKPCGDCLSPGATPLLEELGVREAVEATGSGRLGGWRIRTPSGRWFGGRFDGAPGDAPSLCPPGGREGGPGPAPATGLAVRRRDLDATLVEAAASSGASLRERVRVFGLVREGGRVAGVRARDRRGREVVLEADVVVGADGLRSAVARRLAGVRRGPHPRLALVGRFAGVAGPRGEGPAPGGHGPDATAPAGPVGDEPPSSTSDGAGARGEMRLGRDGCLGLAPVGEGRWNASLVVPAERAREISSDRRAFFREGLRRYGVGPRFRDARPLGELQVTGPFRVSPRRRAAPGALLAGDAAGYFDPLTGQGIFRALATGRAAADAVRRILEADGAAARAAARQRYTGELRRLLAPGRRVQAVVDAVCRQPLLVEGAGALLARRPALASLLVDVAGDRLRASALIDPRRLGPALLARPPRGPTGPADGDPAGRRPGADPADDRASPSDAGARNGGTRPGSPGPPDRPAAGRRTAVPGRSGSAAPTSRA